MGLCLMTGFPLINGRGQGVHQTREGETVPTEENQYFFETKEKGTIEAEWF